MQLRPDIPTIDRKRPWAGLDPRWLMLFTAVGCAHPLAIPQPVERVAPPPLLAQQSAVPAPKEPPAVVAKESAPAPPVAAVKESSQPIPLHVMAGAIEPLQADDPTLPTALMTAARGKVLEGAYKMCISADGSVMSVTPVVSIAGADRSIVEALSTWKFPRLPVTICKVQTLSFEIP